MDKAIIKLKNIQNNPNFCDNCQGLDYCNNFNEKKICNMFFEINEALAELQAHKAKIDELKQYYGEQIVKESQEWVSNAKMEAYQEILEKLEELDR